MKNTVSETMEKANEFHKEWLKITDKLKEHPNYKKYEESRTTSQINDFHIEVSIEGKDGQRIKSTGDIKSEEHINFIRKAVNEFYKASK